MMPIGIPIRFNQHPGMRVLSFEHCEKSEVCAKPTRASLSSQMVTNHILDFRGTLFIFYGKNVSYL